MGQYYMPVIRSSDGSMQKMYSHDYDNGLKLMEHSYLGNRFVNAVLSVMEYFCKEEDYVRLYWIGDYASDVIPKEDTDKLNAYRFGWDDRKPNYKYEPSDEFEATVGWIVHNLDTHEVLNIPAFGYGWTINVLPLLTNCGNGQGGGDFDGILKLDGKTVSVHDIGPWAGNRLNVMGIHSNDPDDVERTWVCLEHNDPDVKQTYLNVYVKEGL